MPMDRNELIEFEVENDRVARAFAAANRTRAVFTHFYRNWIGNGMKGVLGNARKKGTEQGHP